MADQNNTYFWIQHHIEILENRVFEAREHLASIEAELEIQKQAFRELKESSNGYSD